MITEQPSQSAPEMTDAQRDERYVGIIRAMEPHALLVEHDDCVKRLARASIGSQEWNINARAAELTRTELLRRLGQ